MLLLSGCVHVETSVFFPPFLSQLNVKMFLLILQLIAVPTSMRSSPHIGRYERLKDFQNVYSEDGESKFSPRYFANWTFCTPVQTYTMETIIDVNNHSPTVYQPTVLQCSSDNFIQLCLTKQWNQWISACPDVTCYHSTCLPVEHFVVCLTFPQLFNISV
uniref:Uncharacterized protein n=1 Tax=Mola mola TaxID=94237 RepID=A0A3Q4BQ79_MOLML